MIYVIGDYRVSRFCPVFNNIQDKKDDLVQLIRQKHPRATDLYAIISPNKSEFKIPFMSVYNCKCSYCGVSIDIIPKDNFEVDHYIYKKNTAKFKTVAQAGTIKNLVLACRRCNHQKGKHTIPDAFLDTLSPDLEQIKSVFIRNNNFEISIAEEYADSPVIKAFYDKLQLGQEVHRLDFLLMEMLGRQNSGDHTLGQAIALLKKKRNLL